MTPRGGRSRPSGAAGRKRRSHCGRGLGPSIGHVAAARLIQERVPAAVHGRAFAAYNAARNTAELAALPAGGLLVAAVGARSALLIAGLGPVLAGAAGLAALVRRDAVLRPALQ